MSLTRGEDAEAPGTFQNLNLFPRHVIGFFTLRLGTWNYEMCFLYCFVHCGKMSMTFSKSKCIGRLSLVLKVLRIVDRIQFSIS